MEGGNQRPLIVSYVVALKQWKIYRIQTVYKINTVLEMLEAKCLKTKFFIQSQNYFPSLVIRLFSIPCKWVQIHEKKITIFPKCPSW